MAGQSPTGENNKLPNDKLTPKVNKTFSGQNTEQGDKTKRKGAGARVHPLEDSVQVPIEDKSADGMRARQSDRDCSLEDQSTGRSQISLAFIFIFNSSHFALVIHLDIVVVVLEQTIDHILLLILRNRCPQLFAFVESVDHFHCVDCFLHLILLQFEQLDCF